MGVGTGVRRGGAGVIEVRGEAAGVLLSNLVLLDAPDERLIEPTTKISTNQFYFKTVTSVIINSEFLKRHLKAECRAPACSRTLSRVRGVVQRVIKRKSKNRLLKCTGCCGGT